MDSLRNLAALPAAGGPHSLEHLQGVVGVPAGSSPALRRLSPTPGGRLAAATRRRRALSRLQPVTAQTSSRIRPLSFFDALVYALAYFPVISALACTRQPTSHAHHGPQLRGQSYMRHRPSYAGILHESRRGVDDGRVSCYCLLRPFNS